MARIQQDGGSSSVARRFSLLWLACASAAIAIASAQAQTYSETVLHSFASTQALKGQFPSTAVIRDEAGNLYGATSRGGTWDVGVVYKVDAAGVETVLHTFAGRAQGVNPIGNMIRDGAGNLYGTTLTGGTPTGATCSIEGGCGVVYKIDTTGHETVLYAFTGGNDGAVPYSGVIRDAAGNIYGTTAFGGTKYAGVVFKLDTAGHETVLHNFTGGADGGGPTAGVLLDSGNLYGTTECGGTGDLRPHNCSVGAGVVFKLDAAGHETVLYNFTGGADGGYPDADVIRDSAGNLYGTTSYGGIGDAEAGRGVVYKLDQSGHETVLHTFTGGADGAFPLGRLFRDPAGNLYGTATQGGKGGGVLYKVDAAGNFSVLHRFTGGADGSGPGVGVIAGSSGNLYGTTQSGGTGNQGTVYKVDGSGQETVIYSFLARTDGIYPHAGVVRDSAGNLYGTTSDGGTARNGTVYKVDASGKHTVLYNFTNGTNGAGPESGVILDSTGNLYGTTFAGGAGNSAGTVYKLNPARHETVLYSFTGGADGANPTAGVTFDSAGNLYGTTTYGGTAHLGVVYKLNPAGGETVLHTFTGKPDGAQPTAGVVFDPAGNLYGSTYQGGEGNCHPQSGCGVVYKVDAAHNYSVLHTFTGGNGGGGPWSGVIRDSAGNLYGTTYQGGAHGFGVVFKLDKAGYETVLYTFMGEADGGNPIGGLILDAAGNLYGTTGNAGIPVGSHGKGVVFKLDADGNYTVLHTFVSPPDGSTPYGGVILDPAGNLYGTTRWGGKLNDGVVFKLTPQ